MAKWHCCVPKLIWCRKSCLCWVQGLDYSTGHTLTTSQRRRVWAPRLIGRTNHQVSLQWADQWLDSLYPQKNGIDNILECRKWFAMPSIWNNFLYSRSRQHHFCNGLPLAGCFWISRPHKTRLLERRCAMSVCHASTFQARWVGPSVLEALWSSESWTLNEISWSTMVYYIPPITWVVTAQKRYLCFIKATNNTKHNRFVLPLLRWQTKISHCEL